MNFQDLLVKISALDQPVGETMQPAVQAIGAAPSTPATPEETGDSGHLSLGEENPDQTLDVHPDELDSQGEPNWQIPQDDKNWLIPKNPAEEEKLIQAHPEIRDLLQKLQAIQQGHGVDEVGGAMDISGSSDEFSPTDAHGGDVLHTETLPDDHPQKYSPTEEEYSNEPHPITYGIEKITQSGDDLSGNLGSHAQRQNTLVRGAPKMEALVQRLNDHYQAIKEDRTYEGVVDVANTLGQGVGSVVGTAKDAWNAAKQGYNQTSNGSSTPANNVPAPMTPKGSLGLPPGGGAKTPAPAVRPNTPNASSIPQPSMQPDSNPMTTPAPDQTATPAPGQTADSLGPNVDEEQGQWFGEPMPGGYQDQATKQLGKFMGDQSKLDFIDQLKNSPEMLARMGLAIVGAPTGRVADNLGFGPGAAKAKADANAKQDFDPMEESADLTAMLKIAGLR
jgi:hypothetical protein